MFFYEIKWVLSKLTALLIKSIFTVSGRRPINEQMKWVRSIELVIWFIGILWVHWILIKIQHATHKYHQKWEIQSMKWEFTTPLIRVDAKIFKEHWNSSSLVIIDKG